MRVLYPIGSFYPAQSGGPNNSVHTVATFLKKRKCEPIIVTTTDGIKQEYGIQSDKWIDTSYGRIRYTSALFHYLPFKALVHASLVLHRVDIVHLNNLFYPLSWSVALVNMIFYRRPVVWSLRGELNSEAMRFNFRLKSLFLNLIDRYILRGTVIHTTSFMESSDVGNRLKNYDRIVEIPNYIDIPENLDIEKEKILLFLGRIHPIKGIDLLIQAASLSNSFLHSDFRIKIVGDDRNDYGIYLKKLTNVLGLESKIDFEGYRDGYAKIEILRKAYFLILPSHTENFGNVVVEALSQKTPVIASKNTPWSLLESWKAGYWINNSPERIADAIDKVLALSEVEYRQYSINAMQLVQKKFSIERGIDQWLELYQSMKEDNRG